MCVNRLKLNADKTELLWAGSRYSPASNRYCSSEWPCPSSWRDGVVGLDEHNYYLQSLRNVLRQLRRSLDVESAAALVRTFVTSRVEYLQRYSRW